MSSSKVVLGNVDLVAHIFRFLNDLDHRELGSTCRSMEDMAKQPHAWPPEREYKFKMTDWPPGSGSAPIHKMRLTSLILSRHDDPVPKGAMRNLLMSSMESLTSLEFRSFSYSACWLDAIADVTSTVGGWGSRIERLALSGSYAIVQGLVNLIATTDTVGAQCSILPSLVELQVDCSLELAIDLLAGLPNLTDLTLRDRGCESILDGLPDSRKGFIKQLGGILSSMPLVALDVDGIHRSVIPFELRCSTLENLFIRLDDFTDELLTDLINHHHDRSNWSERPMHSTRSSRLNMVIGTMEGYPKVRYRVHKMAQLKSITTLCQITNEQCIDLASIPSLENVSACVDWEPLVDRVMAARGATSSVKDVKVGITTHKIGGGLLVPLLLVNGV